MANIYLRVPTYVAQFYRGREVQHPLSENDPVEFSPFQHEHVLMSACLQLDTDINSHSSACFSQRAWRNILQGKQPHDGKRILTRDEEVWPTMQEICMLTGEKKIQRMDGYDYLCIEMPKHIVVGRQYKQTNPSFTLPPTAATDLQRMLRNEFIPDADLRKYFGVADLIVQPYKSATQSGVTQVAFHFEKPTLVTNVGGLGEIVHDHKMGYACNPDAQSIATDLLDYFNNSRQSAFTQYLINEKSKYAWSNLTQVFLNISNLNNE